MRKFKTIDYWVSILLILAFIIISLVNMDGTFIIGYFATGAWQIISMIVHTYNRWFTVKGSDRTIYHWITLIAVITLPVGSFFLLLFAAPFMAVYYTYLCYHEVNVKMQRPLALLK